MRQILGSPCSTKTGPMEGWRKFGHFGTSINLPGVLAARKLCTKLIPSPITVKSSPSHWCLEPTVAIAVIQHTVDMTDVKRISQINKKFSWSLLVGICYLCRKFVRNGCEKTGISSRQSPWDRPITRLHFPGFGLGVLWIGGHLSNTLKENGFRTIRNREEAAHLSKTGKIGSQSSKVVKLRTKISLILYVGDEGWQYPSWIQTNFWNLKRRIFL